MPRLLEGVRGATWSLQYTVEEGHTRAEIYEIKRDFYPITIKINLLTPVCTIIDVDPPQTDVHMADEDAVVTAEESPSPDAKLAAMLDAHAAGILAYVEGVRTQVAEAVADAEDNDAEKESLLKRNTELALILSHSQKTASEQEVFNRTPALQPSCQLMHMHRRGCSDPLTCMMIDSHCRLPRASRANNRWRFSRSRRRSPRRSMSSRS